MANSYTQIYIQYVFSVKYRNCFLHSNDQELQKYINGIITNLNCKPIAINNMQDHIHIFVAQHPAVSISELAQKMKNNSSSWLKRHLQNDAFAWQIGYGAFSYAKSQTNSVYKYIENQQIHHQEHTFQYEYRKLLELFDIDFEDEYLFEFFDD